MGSNIQGEAHLRTAREVLSHHFPDVRFGREMVTEAVGQGFLSPFCNQMAGFTTSLSADEVHALFKQMEHDAGRRPGDKAQGVVKLDVDLLIYDRQVLKPEDLKREYIVEERKRFKPFG
jgi:2-amino-4-hydroxy-6-hydroxymethyldihydropteridine diphosphokinase